MPQVAIGAIAKFLIGVGFKALAANFIASVFVYAAAAALLNRISRPKRRGAGLGTGTEVNYYDSGASIRIVYGKVRVGGMETIPPQLSGDSLEKLHKVLTIAGHEVDSYTDTHFDTININNSFIGPMAFTSSDGQVTGDKFNGHAWIRRYRGTSTDSADRILCDVNSTRFGLSRAPGIAKAALTFSYNADIYKAVPTVTFTIQGKRCYDPRLDSSPGADPTNASYAAWTQNPALCLVDYLMATYGGEYSADDIDWTTVVTAANACDATVNVPGGTQPRYTCNGVLMATEDFIKNVRALVDCMLGRVIFRDGKWRIYAGSWQTPTFSIQKSDWISGLSIRFEQGRRKRFNRMHCWYVDANRDWQRVECMPRSNSTYRTADGAEPIDAETEQLLCTNEYETQRKTEFLLRQSRNQITVTGRLPPRFQDVALWDTGTIVFDHFGWNSKTFRCTGMDLHEDGSMDGVFLEEQSGDWTDLDAADYNTESTATLPVTNATQPSAPLGLSVTPNLNGTLLFSWNRPVVAPAGYRYELVMSTNSANAAVGSTIWSGNAERVELVAPYAPRFYFVRAYANSQYGPFSPNTFGVIGMPIWNRTPELKDPVFVDGDFDQSPTTTTTFWIGVGSFTAGGFPLGWYLDTTSGYTAGRGSLLLQTNNLGGLSQVTPARRNQTAVNFLREAQLQMTYCRVSSDRADFLLQLYAQFFGNKSSITSYGLVNTTIFVSSLSVGEWRTSVFSLSMPNSEIHDVRAHLFWNVDSHGSSNAGRTRIGQLQMFMS